MTASSPVIRKAWKMPASGNSSTLGQKVVKTEPLITLTSGNSSTKPRINLGENQTSRRGLWIFANHVERANTVVNMRPGTFRELLF